MYVVFGIPNTFIFCTSPLYKQTGIAQWDLHGAGAEDGKTWRAPISIKLDTCININFHLSFHIEYKYVYLVSGGEELEVMRDLGIFPFFSFCIILSKNFRFNEVFGSNYIQLLVQL